VRYSLLGGGKRLRPILALAACEAVGGDVDAVMPLACALEMIHTYSLVHDDLPSMDDDALRRGRPTLHIAFDEGLAVLAGDALLTEAFAVLMRAAEHARPAAPALQAAREIAEAAGLRGMVGGQAADLAAEGQEADLPLVEFIHVRKTGALLLAAVRAGGLVGGADDGQLRGLTRYGECLGLAFQIADDILDVEASSVRTGKTVRPRRPAPQGDVPGVLGMAAAKERACELRDQAVDALTGCPRRPTRCARWCASSSGGRRAGEPRAPRQAVGRSRLRRQPRARTRHDHGRRGTGRRPRRGQGRHADRGRCGDQRRGRRSPVCEPRRRQARGGLDALAIDVAGRLVLDVGASTGGFTDCVLQRGARAVIAVDVGYGQLAWSLRQDPRVTLIERCNVRHLEADRLPARPDFAVVDASFISLTLILPRIAELVAPCSPIVALVKPQFEVGKGQVGRGGSCGTRSSMRAPWSAFARARRGSG
jgi:geranylgeranyl diphosphate synthase type II